MKMYMIVERKTGHPVNPYRMYDTKGRAKGVLTSTREHRPFHQFAVVEVNLSSVSVIPEHKLLEQDYIDAVDVDIKKIDDDYQKLSSEEVSWWGADMKIWRRCLEDTRKKYKNLKVV